jgi:hypothetical protein
VKRKPAIPEQNSAQWADLYFDDGRTHTGVRVLRGTTVIEVQHRGRKVLIDIADFVTIDFSQDKVYSK